MDAITAVLVADQDAARSRKHEFEVVVADVLVGEEDAVALVRRPVMMRVAIGGRCRGAGGRLRSGRGPG